MQAARRRQLPHIASNVGLKKYYAFRRTHMAIQWEAMALLIPYYLSLITYCLSLIPYPLLLLFSSCAFSSSVPLLNQAVNLTLVSLFGAAIHALAGKALWFQVYSLILQSKIEA